jgi:hypothetical protein
MARAQMMLTQLFAPAAVIVTLLGCPAVLLDRGR